MAEGRIKRRRVVAFTWLDAVTSHGWEKAEGRKADKCVASGVVIAETKDEITLAVTVSRDENGEDQMNASMTIPLGWVCGEIRTLGWVEGNEFVKPRRGK